MIYLYIILTLNFLWLSILTFAFFKILFHYKKLTRGAENENLMGVWEKCLEKGNRNEANIKSLTQGLDNLREKSRLHVQKDENGDGMVLSSLHGRGLTRVYAKPVKQFTSQGFDFSQEEQDAVLIAKDAKH